MKTIKGPAIFLAQFANDVPPFNRLTEISRWVAALGYTEYKSRLGTPVSSIFVVRLRAAATVMR